MVEVKTSVPTDIYDKYQKLVQYIYILYNNIVSKQETLKLQVTPVYPLLLEPN